MNYLNIKTPYERQDGEPRKAYAAFCLYRDMAERSYHVLADLYLKERKFSCSHNSMFRQISRWASKYHWVRRADAWDAEKDKHKRRMIIIQVEKTQERRMQIASNLQGWALTELKKAIELSKSRPEILLTAREILGILEYALRLESDTLYNESATKTTQVTVTIEQRQKAIAQALKSKDDIEVVNALLARLNPKVIDVKPSPDA